LPRTLLTTTDWMIGVKIFGASSNRSDIVSESLLNGSGRKECTPLALCAELPCDRLWGGNVVVVRTETEIIGVPALSCQWRAKSMRRAVRLTATRARSIAVLKQKLEKHSDSSVRERSSAY